MEAALWIGSAVAAVSFILYLLQKRRAAFAGVFVLLGLLTVSLHYPQACEVRSQGERSRVVAEEVRATAFNQRAIVRPLSGDGRVLLYYHSSYPEIEPGDTLEFTAPVSALSREEMDGKSGGYGYAFRSYATGVTHISDGGLSIRAASGGFANRIWRWRMDVADSIERIPGLSEGASSLLAAVLTGESGDLDPEVRENFARAGIAHILALSGAHIAVILLIAGFVLFPLRAGDYRRSVAGVVIVLLWFYAVFTGLSASVVRATIMATVLLCGVLLRRSSQPLNNLLLAAILILIFDPRALWTVGFQLSFLATSGILLFVPLMLPERFPNRLVATTWIWIAVSLAAMVATAPLAAYRFHLFPTLFLAGNILASVVLPPFMIGGVVALGCSVVGLPALWLSRGLNQLWHLLDGACGAIARLPWGAVDGCYFSGWWLPVVYGLILIIWWCWRASGYEPSISSPRRK